MLLIPFSIIVLLYILINKEISEGFSVKGFLIHYMPLCAMLIVNFGIVENFDGSAVFI